MTLVIAFDPSVPGDARLRVYAVDASGHINHHGSAMPQDAGAHDRTIVIVPGEQLLLRQVAIGEGRPKQQLAAARFHASQHSLAPPEGLHVALDAARAGDHGRWIAGVDRRLLADWLAELAQFGIEPDALVPAALLLGDSAHGGSPGRWGSYVIGRQDTLAYAVEEDLASELASAGVSPDRLDEGATLSTLVLAAAQGSGLNLLSGDFDARSAAAWRWARLRRPAILAACALGLVLAISIVQGARDSAAARRISAQNIDMVRAALPEASRIVNAPAQLREALRASGAGRHQASALISTLMTAMPADVALEVVSYDLTTGLTGTLLGGVDLNLDPLQVAARDAGLDFIPGARRDSPSGVRVDFTMRAP